MNYRSRGSRRDISGEGGVGGHAATVATPTSGHRLVGIEGLRGLAALSVLIAHVHVHLGSRTELGGLESVVNLLGQGLTLFFALSGFLLYRPFVGHLLDSKPYPIIRYFLLNRVLRIYPAYIVILLISSLVLGVAYVESIPAGDTVEGAKSTVGFMTDPVLLGLNATLLHTLLPVSIKTGLGVSWTLTVEVAFYLILPLLVALSIRLSAKRRERGLAIKQALIPPLFLLLIGLGTKTYLFFSTQDLDAAEEFYFNWGGNWNAVLSRSLLAHADLFAFGMAVAALVSWERSGRMKRTEHKVMIAASWFSLPVALVIAKITPLDDTMFALASAAVILLVCFRTRRGEVSSLAKILELLPLRYTGLVSYSFYLWHIPVIWLLARNQWTFPADSLWSNVLLVFAVTLVLAALTYHFVESPALRLKTAPTANKPIPANSRAGLPPFWKH